MVSFRFHHVFGLSVETVEDQPVLGFRLDQTIDEAEVYFFDGYIINIPFVKIMIGHVWGVKE